MGNVGYLFLHLFKQAPTSNGQTLLTDAVSMDTSLHLCHRGNDGVQSEDLIPAEAELEEPNADWSLEPVFNLNLSLSSPRSPIQASETPKPQGANKSDNGTKGAGNPGAKGAVTTETRTLGTPVSSPGERTDPLWQKSKIPALSHSAEGTMKSRGEQRVKSLNPKRAPTLGPTTGTFSSAVPSPKPQPAALSSTIRTTRRDKTQLHRTESGSFSEPQTAPTTGLTTTTNKSLKTNKTSDGGKEGGRDSRLPKTSQPALNPRDQDQKESSKLANHVPTISTKSQQADPASFRSNERTGPGSRTHSSETPHLGSHFKNQRAETTNLSSKNPQLSSLSPRSSRDTNTSGSVDGNGSGSKKNPDNRDTKTDSDPKVGFEVSLDAKSGSLSKTSCKSGTESREGLNSKSATNPLPTSKPGSTPSTSKPSQEASASKRVTVGPVSTSSSKTSLSGSKDNKLSKAKSGLAELPSVLLSSTPNSAKKSPGTGPGKSLGPNKEVQRSPGSAPGNWLFVSLCQPCGELGSSPGSVLLQPPTCFNVKLKPGA